VGPFASITCCFEGSRPEIDHTVFGTRVQLDIYTASGSSKFISRATASHIPSFHVKTIFFHGTFTIVTSSGFADMGSTEPKLKGSINSTHHGVVALVIFFPNLNATYLRFERGFSESCSPSFEKVTSSPLTS
jgi:hypothetical protein